MILHFAFFAFKLDEGWMGRGGELDWDREGNGMVLGLAWTGRCELRSAGFGPGPSPGGAPRDPREGAQAPRDRHPGACYKHKTSKPQIGQQIIGKGTIASSSKWSALAIQ